MTAAVRWSTWLAVALVLAGCGEDAVPPTWAGPCSALKEHLEDGVFVVDERRTSHYDDAGHLTMTEVDEGGDGTVDERKTYATDEAGRWLAEDVDKGLDGVIDERSEFLYDERGRLMTEMVDSDGDDQPDWAYFYSYEDSDQPAAKQVDQGSDGTMDWFYTYLYYSDGQLAATLVDGNGDGLIDEVQNFVHTWSDGHRQQVTEVDRDNDLKPDRIARMRYDDGANLLLREDDRDADGIFEERQSYAYDCW